LCFYVSFLFFFSSTKHTMYVVSLITFSFHIVQHCRKVKGVLIVFVTCKKVKLFVSSHFPSILSRFPSIFLSFFEKKFIPIIEPKMVQLALKLLCQVDIQFIQEILHRKKIK
jgi:hypothetical protein